MLFGGRVRWISEFEASLLYRVNSRTASDIQRNHVSKNNKNKPNQTIVINTCANQGKLTKGWTSEPIESQHSLLNLANKHKVVDVEV